MNDIRPLDPAQLSRALALNNDHATELSALDAERLAHLVERAFLACRIGAVDGFLLAFDQDADYDSPNFLWFRSRYGRFVYVDRIVVAPAARGRGHARSLYGHLFDHARRAGHERIACEVNLQPPTRHRMRFMPPAVSMRSVAAACGRAPRRSAISCAPWQARGLRQARDDGGADALNRSRISVSSC